MAHAGNGKGWHTVIRRLGNKDPDPENPGVGSPLEGGAHCDLADFSLLLEYWSVGVLESRRQDKHPLGMETEINGFLSACALRDLDHYSNIPLLQHSIALFEAEPSVSDPVQRAGISLLD